MAIPTHKNRIIIVNDNLVGPTMRLNNPSGFHPMVRQSWGMIDKLRAVLANYYAPVAYLHGLTPNEIFINYSNPDSDFPGWLAANQVANIVLDLDFDENATSPILTVTFNEDAWDAFNNRSATSTNFIDDPNSFRAYLKGSYEIPNTQTFPGLLNGIGPVKDHTSVYYLPLAPEGARVQPVYNLYLTTVPPYEDVISNPSVPEYVLPNVYMFQAELQNTGSILLADYHNDALTLGGNVAWFADDTETTEGEYYQLYSAKLQELLAAGPLGDIPGVTNNKNLAILYSDMAIANESHLDIVIPFYNKIVIEDLSNSTTGIKSGGNSPVSILGELAADPNTKDFIDLLQMRTINGIISQDLEAIDFRRELMTRNETWEYQYDTKVAANYALYNLVDVLGALVDNSTSYEEIYENHYAGGLFSLLRDFSRSDFDVDFESSPDNAVVDLNLLVPTVTKTFKQVLDGVRCHTETLMYVIEKRRILDNGELGPIQQRFFISNRFEDTNKPIVYYDSQVKYGQRYRYDIKKIALVFGNEYRYIMPPLPSDLDVTIYTGDEEAATEQLYDTLPGDVVSGPGLSKTVTEPSEAALMEELVEAATLSGEQHEAELLGRLFPGGGPAQPPSIVRNFLDNLPSAKGQGNLDEQLLPQVDILILVDE